MDGVRVVSYGHSMHSHTFDDMSEKLNDRSSGSESSNVTERRMVLIQSHDENDSFGQRKDILPD
jgi:hypothetical protein